MGQIEARSKNPVYPEIILITGNMASGKSTVAQALAERLSRSVHLSDDVFRRMIINGWRQSFGELYKCTVDRGAGMHYFFGLW